MRPIPVSNQKLKDWNNFLVDFNAAARAELPTKPDGTPNWELLDKNEAFGNYKGGQDFYKKKFAEYVANKGVTGTGRLTEADFPVIQKLYSDMYTAAKADPEYFDTYTKPRLTNLGVDTNTFDPSATVTGKGNTEGWVGSVTRNFFFDQDDKTGKGGTNPATSQHLETFFPASFSQGESFYKKNPTGPGVRYFDKGGKMMCYDHGGRMEMDVEVEEGGDLEEVSEDHVVVNSDESTKDSVTLTTGDKVGDKEVINTETKVVFGNLNDPTTGNLFKDDALKRAKEMGQLEGHPMPWAKRRLDVLKRQEAEAYDRQQKLNGDNGGKNHDEGGDLTDPPVKKKLFYVPEDDTVYQVSEDKVPKYADKLKNATEYTDVQPEGYSSDKVYLEKNGVLKEFTKENAEIILKQPEAAGSRQVYPVSTGQKKNQDVQSRFNDIESKLTDHDGLKSSAEISKENITVYKDKIEKQKSEDFPYPYNNIIAQGTNKSDKSPNTYLQNLYPADSDYWLGAAKQMRSEENQQVGNEVIDEMFLEEDKLRDEYGFKELFSKGKNGLINQYNVDITVTPQFKQYIDQKLSGGKIRTKDGNIFDLDKMPDDQKEEIRYFISGFYQQRKDIEEAIKQAELLRNGSEDPEIQKEYVEPRRQLIIEKTGIDPTTLKSSEEWSDIFRQIGEGSQEFVKEFQVMSSNIPIKVQQDLKPIKDEWQLKENQLTEQGVKSLQELKMGLEHLVGAGELDYETAKGKYDAAFNKVEAEKTMLFNDYNQRYNRMSQQKITAGNEALRLSFEAKIVDLIEKSSGFKDLDGKDLSKLVVENATNYYKLIEGNLTEIQSDRANKTGELAAEIWGSKDDWEKWVDHSNKFVMGMFQGLGGGMQYLGGYEGGNMLTDMADQYNAENPTPTNLEYLDLSNPASYLHKEAWMNTGPYLVGSTLLFTLPGMAAGRGTAGLVAASDIEMSELAATTIGSTPMRYIESFINSGQYFNEKVQGGMSIDEAADKTSGVFANNMMLTFMDGGQTTMAFTKAGKSSIWRNILSKSGKVLVGTGSEGVDESLSSYFAAVADNPYITYFQYLQSPAGMQTFSAGATGGIFFAAPDLITESSGKENQHRLGLLLDMMGDPSEIETRYPQLVSTGDMLKTRGTMTMDEYKTFQTALEFVKEKNSAIPVDLPADTRKAVLYKLADIQDATNVMSTSNDPTIQKTYEAKIKELEKEVKDLVVGSSPTYFINNSLFSEQEFKQIISDDRVLKGLADTKTSLRINNDEKLQKELEERIEKIKTLPEAAETATEEAVITEDPTVEPVVENQEVTEAAISETPENTEMIKEDLTEAPVVEETAEIAPEGVVIDIAKPETYTAQPIELEEATSTLGKETLLTYDENRTPVEITTPEQLTEAKEIFVAKPIEAQVTEDVSRETLEPKVSVSPTNTEKAKELADKIRSFKSKPKTIKLTDENGNEIEGIVNTNSFFDEILEVAALAVEASGKLADGVKAALVHVRKQDWYKKLTPEGQVTVDGQIKEMIEGEDEEVKKTITTYRAYEGEFREGVKKELEKLGLTREVESQPEAKKKAKEFIETVGEEAALEAVRNNDVADAAGAYVWNELIERVEAKLATEKDPEKIMELEKQEAQLIDEFGRKALSGGRFNSALNDIYQNSDLGYNVEKKINEYKDQNNGEIPAEVEAKFRAIDKELKEVRKKLVEAEKRAKDAEAQLAIDNIKESITRSNTEKGKKEYAQKALNAIGKLRKSLRANMYSDALGIVAIVDIGLSTIETAIKGGMEISKAINKGVKYIKGRLKEQGIDEWDKEEKFRKDVLEAFQQEGINVGEAAGRLKIPNSVIRDFVERGIDNIEDLVKAIQDEIKDTHPDATEREIRDAITGYGKTVNLNSDEIATQIRKMKRIGRIISGLEDVANKKRPLKSGIQRDKLDAEERALNKELRELMKDLPMDEELQADQLKTATDAAKQRIKNQIEDLQREIDKGEQVKKTARTIQEDEELADLRKQRDELRKQHEAIFKDEEFKEKQRLENTKKATQRRIKELETKIKEGDFSKRKIKTLIADDDLTKLRAEKIRLQEEYDKEFYKNKLTNRTKAQKIKDSIWDAWGLTRLFSATGEFSFIGIQGLIQTIAHPLHAVEAFKNALRFFASEKKTEQWLNTIKSQPFYPEMKQAKLALTETNAEITAREELFYSDWANLIWNMLGSPLKLLKNDAYKKWTNLSPFKAFERAALGYLDTLRVMRFLDGKEMLENQGISSEDNPEAYKQMADVINTMTGRASLGKAEMIAPVLTKIFFSPRNWASIFKTATPYAFYHFGKMRAGAEGFKPSVAQKMAIADFSKFVGLTISFVALAAAYLNNDDDDETGVEFDPRSSDFLKIKLGVKRIDPWGGRIQQVILLSRLISGSVKKESGDIVPLGTPFKAPNRKDLLIEMATNKLAPSASMLEKFLSTRVNEEGERVTKFGQPYDFTDELKEKLTPIYWGTVSDLLKDDPTALDGLLIFYSFIGGGVNVYETKEEKAEKKKKKDE